MGLNQGVINGEKIFLSFLENSDVARLGGQLACLDKYVSGDELLSYIGRR